MTCNEVNNQVAPETPQSIQKMQLRRDISQDGEQLLSDLTKFHMEELPLLVEMSCDISEFLNTTTRKEHQSRRSFVVDEQGKYLDLLNECGIIFCNYRIYKFKVLLQFYCVHL